MSALEKLNALSRSNGIDLEELERKTKEQIERERPAFQARMAEINRQHAEERAKLEREAKAEYEKSDLYKESQALLAELQEARGQARKTVEPSMMQDVYETHSFIATFKDEDKILKVMDRRARGIDNKAEFIEGCAYLRPVIITVYDDKLFTMIDGRLNEYIPMLPGLLQYHNFPQNSLEMPARMVLDSKEGEPELDLEQAIGDLSEKMQKNNEILKALNAYQKRTNTTLVAKYDGLESKLDSLTAYKKTINNEKKYAKAAAHDYKKKDFRHLSRYYNNEAKSLGREEQMYSNRVRGVNDSINELTGQAEAFNGVILKQARQAGEEYKDAINFIFNYIGASTNTIREILQKGTLGEVTNEYTTHEQAVIRKYKRDDIIIVIAELLSTPYNDSRAQRDHDANQQDYNNLPWYKQK